MCLFWTSPEKDRTFRQSVTISVHTVFILAPQHPGGNKECPGGLMASGGLGSKPPARSRGVVRGPPEAESFLTLELPMEQQNLPRFPYSAVIRSSDNLLLGIHNTTPKLLAVRH